MSRSRSRRASPVAIPILGLTSVLIAGLLAACGTPTKPPSTSGPVVHVSPSQDLATAAKDAPAGATLALADGTYALTNTLAVGKDLTLKGSNAGKVTITMATVTTPSIGATSVRSAALGAQATTVNPVVSVSGGTFTATGVTFAYTGSAATDVVIASNDARLNITGCTFTGGVEGTGSLDTLGNGLGMYGTVSGTVEDSTFTKNGHAGFAEDVDNDVAVSNSTSTDNKWGAVFWGTTRGSLKGSTLSNNSMDGVILGSAAAGPTTVLDGNTIENNGVDGILYTGTSAGTASNNAISGNGAKGIRVTDSAHPTLSGNDLHGNTDDGIAFEGDSSGTAKGNQIHDNGSDSLGSKGIRVVGTAHPTLQDNHITGNHDEGIAFIDNAAGTATGNVVSGNTANGIAVVGQATPTLDGNTVQSNPNCGLLLQDSAQPSLSGNTISGNGSDVCDQRQASPPPPIATQCATGDSSANPDPSRYLAVLVEDASGAPVPNVSVTAQLFNDSGYLQDSLYATTDGSGVALVADTTTNTFDPTGTYNGAIVVNPGGGSGPQFQLVCGNIPFPGTVTAAANDPSLSPVSTHLTAGSATVNHAFVAFGFPWGGRTTLVSGFAVGANGQIGVADGSYTAAVTAETSAGSYQVYAPLSVSAATTFDLDVTQQPTVHVSLLGTDDGGAAATSTLGAFFRKDTGYLQTTGYQASGPDIFVTPGSYQIISDLAIQASSSDYFDYSFLLGIQGFGSAGSSQTVQVGGPLTTTVTTDQASYAPGATVYLRPAVLDSQAHALTSVADYSGLAPSAVGTDGSAQPARTLSTRPRLGTQAAGPNSPVLTVRDPSGTVVYQSASNTTYLKAEPFTLSATAPTGTYQVSFSWDIGPYAAAPLTADTTFQVQ